MEQLNGESGYPCSYREDLVLKKWEKQAWLNCLERKQEEKIPVLLERQQKHSFHARF